MTIKDLRKAKQFRDRRRQLLIDTINELMEDKVASRIELADLLKVDPAVITRIRQDEEYLSQEKVEQHLSIILQE